MTTVQVAVAAHEWAERARWAFDQNGNWRVCFVDTVDPDQEGILVMDQRVLDCLRTPPRDPARVVLITRNDPELLGRAWEMGILSVVLETDSADTLLMAIESAALRTDKFSCQPFPAAAWPGVT